jgi:hypothetical protein
VKPGDLVKIVDLHVVYYGSEPSLGIIIETGEAETLFPVARVLTGSETRIYKQYDLVPVQGAPTCGIVVA